MEEHTCDHCEALATTELVSITIREQSLGVGKPIVYTREKLNKMWKKTQDNGPVCTSWERITHESAVAAITKQAAVAASSPGELPMKRVKGAGSKRKRKDGEAASRAAASAAAAAKLAASSAVGTAAGSPAAPAFA